MYQHLGFPSMTYKKVVPHTGFHYNGHIINSGVLRIQSGIESIFIQLEKVLLVTAHHQDKNGESITVEHPFIQGQMYEKKGEDAATDMDYYEPSGQTYLPLQWHENYELVDLAHLIPDASKANRFFHNKYLWNTIEFLDN